jgi:hypothetical protein
MFWQNVKQILNNLPLTLSESYDPKDISLNRVIIAMLAITVLVIVCRILYDPGTADKLVGALDKVLIALGLQLGSNTLKRGFDTWKQIKGGDNVEANNLSGSKTTSFTGQE